MITRLPWGCSVPPSAGKLSVFSSCRTAMRSPSCTRKELEQLIAGEAIPKKTGRPEWNDKVKPCKMVHLKRLNRLGILMSELVNEDIPSWEKKDFQGSGDVREYITARDSYRELFPNLSERTRQRDFQVLRDIGFDVYYDQYDHCFRQDDFRFPLGWTDAPEKIDDAFLDGTL